MNVGGEDGAGVVGEGGEGGEGEETIGVLDPGILVVEEVRLMDIGIYSGDECEFECVREMRVCK